MSKLKTPVQALATILAVAANAEHDYNEKEQAAVCNMADVLEMPELPAQVAEELEVARNLQGEALADYLIDASKQVVDGEEAYLMEAAMQVVLADGLFAHTEASNLLILANALHFNHDLVLLMVADALREDTAITVTIAE